MPQWKYDARSFDTYIAVDQWFGDWTKQFSFALKAASSLPYASHTDPVTCLRQLIFPSTAVQADYEVSLRYVAIYRQLRPNEACDMSYVGIDPGRSTGEDPAPIRRRAFNISLPPRSRSVPGQAVVYILEGFSFPVSTSLVQK